MLQINQREFTLFIQENYLLVDKIKARETHIRLKQPVTINDILTFAVSER